jgi:hypothetical protein
MSAVWAGVGASIAFVSVWLAVRARRADRWMKRCEDSKKQDLAKLRRNAPQVEELEGAWQAHYDDLKTLALSRLRDPWIVASFYSMVGQPDNRALQAQRVVQRAFASVCRRLPSLFAPQVSGQLEKELVQETLFFVIVIMWEEDLGWLRRHLVRMYERLLRRPLQFFRK